MAVHDGPPSTIYAMEGSLQCYHPSSHPASGPLHASCGAQIREHARFTGILEWFLDDGAGYAMIGAIESAAAPLSISDALDMRRGRTWRVQMNPSWEILSKASCKHVRLVCPRSSSRAQLKYQ